VNLKKTGAYYYQSGYQNNNLYNNNFMYQYANTSVLDTPSSGIKNEKTEKLS
jgi:hypothetical protein